MPPVAPALHTSSAVAPKNECFARAWAVARASVHWGETLCYQFMYSHLWNRSRLG